MYNVHFVIYKKQYIYICIYSTKAGIGALINCKTTLKSSPGDLRGCCVLFMYENTTNILPFLFPFRPRSDLSDPQS